jgi:hypothetical protein
MVDIQHHLIRLKSAFLCTGGSPVSGTQGLDHARDIAPHFGIEADRTRHGARTPASPDRPEGSLPYIRNDQGPCKPY